MTAYINIISCGTSLLDLTEQHKAIIADAEILAGGKRLLNWFPDFAGKKLIIEKNPEKTLDALYALSKHKKVVILASGDAMLFGIGRLCAQKFPKNYFRVFPNISIPQAIASKLAIPMEDISIYSLHGRTSTLPYYKIFTSKVAVIYLDSKHPPSLIASKLLNYFPKGSTKKCFIFEDIGSPNEKIIQTNLAKLKNHKKANLTTLVVINDETEPMPPLPLGLADRSYIHSKSMITHQEVRAIVLSKLNIRPGIMWDVGAGSGSVGIEASLLCASLKVFAVEKNKKRCQHIMKNVEANGASNLSVIWGVAPSVYKNLPSPDIVFIGGGGKDILEIVEGAFNRLRPTGTLVSTAIMLETKKSLLDFTAKHPSYFVEMLEINLARSVVMNNSNLRMNADNPISIFVFKKDED